MKEKYKITPKLRIRIYKLMDGWSLFWLFIAFSSLLCFLYFFLEFYVYHFGTNNMHLWSYNKSLTLRFIRIIEESSLITFVLLVFCLLIIDLTIEANKLIQWSIVQLKKFRLNKRLVFISISLLFGILLIWSVNYIITMPRISPELKALEKKAEAGDTIALHKLLRYYDDNTDILMEVVEVIDANGNEIFDDEEVNTALGEPVDDKLQELYSERLWYWIEKGISIKDPLAKQIAGMRLYYEDESVAIPYLAEMAENGDGQAALFCGSACFNQGKGTEAFKYLTMAYEMGVPSAGWHLAMCYSRGFGTVQNKEMAIEVMKHSALLNYPEAVLEMKRIEPNNLLWQNKADSLEIDFPDFVIIDE